MMNRRGNTRLLTSLYVSLRSSGLKEASAGKTFDVCFPLVYLLALGFVFISAWRALSRAAYETVKAGQRLLSEGRHASLSSSFSEIEFGRARPTSLLHSTIHLLIPSGEERGRENEVQEWEEGGRERGRGIKEGHKVQRREAEKRGKWPE